jgi:hypothetical protein
LKISNSTLKTLINKRLKLNISSTSRKREIVEARNIYFSICFHRMGMTATSISKTLSKNHATVLHALKKTDEWYEVDDNFKAKYDDIINLAEKLNGIGSNQATKQNDINTITSKQIILELQKENKMLKEKYTKLLLKKNMMDDLNIPDELVDQVKERISLYLKSLEWKGKEYKGEVYLSY